MRRQDPTNVFLGVYHALFKPCYYVLHLLLPTGKNQLSAFSKALGKNRTSVNIQELIKVRGYLPKDIGIHSIRKGASTYAVNGIVGVSASIFAICLRAC
jgi:hypothetical protein